MRAPKMPTSLNRATIPGIKIFLRQFHLACYSLGRTSIRASRGGHMGLPLQLMPAYAGMTTCEGESAPLP